MQGVRKFAAAMVLLATAVLVVVVPQALAADTKTFGVLPFTINGDAKYQYLSKGVQDMMLSRLYWKDHVIPKDKAALANVAAPGGSADAEALRSSLGVDYLVWGSVTIMDKQASLDMSGLGADGQTWAKSEQTEMSQLIPALDSMAKAVNAELFGREVAPLPVAVQEQPKEKVKMMNPGLVYNEADASKEFYLNPQFRYAGDSADTGRLQSQRLNFTARGMVADDVDGDGTVEVILLDKNDVWAYHFVKGMLKPLAHYKGASTLECLNINLVDLNKDGVKEIVIAAVEEDRTPKSFLLRYRGGKFEVVDRDIMLFLSVVNAPPNFIPTLVGQKRASMKLFDSKVYEMYLKGGEVKMGQRLFTPEKGNVFNLSFYPYQTTHKIVQVDDMDKIKVYTASGQQQYRSDKDYAGTSVGLSYYNLMAGMAVSEGDMADFYYIPMRTLAVDLDRDKRFELITSHPVSVASQVFGRYRSFPQGEIQALFWDGVGMNLLWKTRRIKGSIQDFALADVNGDGGQELCVCVVTQPGALGASHRKTIVLFYPLDTAKTNAPVAREFGEENAQ